MLFLMNAIAVTILWFWFVEKPVLYTMLSVGGCILLWQWQRTKIRHIGAENTPAWNAQALLIGGVGMPVGGASLLYQLYAGAPIY